MTLAFTLMGNKIALLPKRAKNRDSEGMEIHPLVDRRVVGGVGLDRPALDGAKDVGLGCCRHQHWSLKKY